MKLNSIAFLFFAITYSTASAQFSDPEVDIPKDEHYLYPINPGQPGSLAGSMGELRTTHFHTGIDIRTNNEIGFPVLASKSGYISRIGMSPTGFGNVIYITHPDGNTTVYGHLYQFKGPWGDYVLKEQYRRKTFDIDLFFRENQFVVKQGDTIALSGNTGSSGGPHLHFDIRDSNNDALNPLKFKFSEIVDTSPPAVEKIALRTLDENSRINDRFGRFEFYAYRNGNAYVIGAPILAYGNIGVELLAKDKFDPRSRFFGGVNYIDMKVDDALIFRQAIDKLNLVDSRRILTLLDYKTMRSKGSRFYKLYLDDGNTLDFYEASPSSGVIQITDGGDKAVNIVMKDTYGNASTVSFTLKPTPPAKEVLNLEQLKVPISYDIDQNTLIVSTKPALSKESAKAVVFTKGIGSPVDPSYQNSNQMVYLIDLKKGLPDSVIVNDNTVKTNLKAMIPSTTEYKYYSDELDIDFPFNALFDTLYLNLEHTWLNDSSEFYTIGESTVPLNRSIRVSLHPKNTYTWDDRIAVYRVSGRSYSYVGGTMINGKIRFSTRDLGTFTILRDTKAPSIRPLMVNRQTLRFKISDDLSGISSYEASVDGHWLLMHYDAKTGIIWSQKLDIMEPLTGEVELVVTDNAGNKQVFKQKIL